MESRPWRKNGNVLIDKCVRWPVFDWMIPLILCISEDYKSADEKKQLASSLGRLILHNCFIWPKWESVSIILIENLKVVRFFWLKEHDLAQEHQAESTIPLIRLKLSDLRVFTNPRVDYPSLVHQATRQQIPMTMKR